MMTELSMISMIAYFVMKKFKSFVVIVKVITSFITKMCQLWKTEKLKNF